MYKFELVSLFSATLPQLLKKSDRDDDVDSDRIKDKSDNGESERLKWEKAGGQMKPKDAKEK